LEWNKLANMKTSPSGIDLLLCMAALRPHDVARRIAGENLAGSLFMPAGAGSD
jgi:hypothetical protein